MHNLWIDSKNLKDFGIIVSGENRLQSLRMLPQTRQRPNHCRQRENFQAVCAVRRKREPNEERRDCSCVVPSFCKKIRFRMMHEE